MNHKLLAAAKGANGILLKLAEVHAFALSDWGINRSDVKRQIRRIETAIKENQNG